jgi:hypothetical protein
MTSVADLGNNERRYSVSLSSCLARAHYQTRQGWLFAARAPQRCGRHHDRDRSIKGRSQRRKRRPPSEGRLTPAYTLGSHANPIERRPAGQSSCMCLRSCCRSMCRRSPRPDHRRGRQKRNPAQREAGRDEKNCALKPRPARQRPPDMEGSRRAAIPFAQRCCVQHLRRGSQRLGLIHGELLFGCH